MTNFIAIKAFIARELLRYKNPYPYIDGLLLRSTQKIANVPMQDRERLSGSSGYTLRKLISLLPMVLRHFPLRRFGLQHLWGL